MQNDPELKVMSRLYERYFKGYRICIHHIKFHRGIFNKYQDNYGYSIVASAQEWLSWKSSILQIRKLCRGELHFAPAAALSLSSEGCLSLGSKGTATMLHKMNPINRSKFHNSNYWHSAEEKVICIQQIDASSWAHTQPKRRWQWAESVEEIPMLNISSSITIANILVCYIFWSVQ